jgi:integrase/recombinase XerD
MDEVRPYQLHLFAQKLSWSHINQVSCAPRFFYGVNLGHPAHWRNAHANN